MLPPPRSHHTPPPPPHAPQFRQGMFKLEFKARQQARRDVRSVELNKVIHHNAAFRQQAMGSLRRLLNAFDAPEPETA